jgi:hypothetical protein
MKGKEIQDGIAQLARTKGYRVAHFSPARVGPRDRFITNYAYDSKGWPDLALFRERDGRKVAIEVKGDGDTLPETQDEWLSLLRACGFTAAVITSKDWLSGVVDGMLE